MEATPVVERRLASVADLGGVYDAVFDEVYGYAARLAGQNRQLAEDVVHDVFVDLVRRVSGGDAVNVSIGWFMIAVRHRVIYHARHRASGESVRRRIAGARPSNTAGVGDDVGELLAGLTPVERVALVMRHVDGCAIAEVATVVGRSRRATESLLARARQRVRRMSTERT